MNYIRGRRPFSNQEVNRAGILLANPTDDESFRKAMDVIADWRTWHQGPVARFRTILEMMLAEVDSSGFIATRLNPTTSLNELIATLTKYPTRTSTALAVKLNRRGNLELPSIPKIVFSQLWFFWASAPNSERWCLYGDALRSGPKYFDFYYPEGAPKKLYGSDGKPLPLR